MTSLISSTPIRTYIDEVKAFADTYLRDKDTLLDVVSITERLNQASSLVSKGNSLTSPSSDPELFLAQLDAISIQQELNKKIAAISLPALTLATATSMPVPSERPALLKRQIPRNLRSEEPSQVFKDKEILKIYPIIKREQIAGKGLKPETSGPIQYIDQLSDVYAEYTANGKAIIQQQSNTSSSAAAACMVILDRLGSLPESFHSDLFYRRGSTNKAIVSDIQTAGLIAATAKFRSLEEHKKKLEKYGPIIQCMTFSSGFHYIVIDAISDDLKSVRIRDPYHGWEIDVRAEAFIKHLGHDISRGIVALKSKPKEK